MMTRRSLKRTRGRSLGSGIGSTIRRRALGGAAALAAGLSVCVLAVAPASATTVASHWNLASAGVDASGKTFTGSGGTFEIVTTINGSVMAIDCTGVGFSYTTPAVTLHAAPYGAISIGLDPDSGTCTESLSGTTVTMSTTAASRWPLTFTVPAASAPSPNIGPFTGTLTIPPNSVTIDLTSLLGCTLVLPSSPLPMTASYDGGTGLVTKTGSMSSLGVSGCPWIGSTAALTTTSVTLSETGFPLRHPNLIYVP